jgi:hypothetical protein
VRFVGEEKPFVVNEKAPTTKVRNDGSVMKLGGTVTALLVLQCFGAGAACSSSDDSAQSPSKPTPDASDVAPTDAGGNPDATRTASDASLSGDAGPVTTHEPAGMSVQIDTGPITTAPPTGFTMYSPVALTSTGESSTNLILVPDGTGVRLLYNPSLSGGNSPVRFGHSIGAPGSTTYYQRWRVRTVTNWAGPRNGNGVKMCEPQFLNLGPGSGTGTNDILMMWPNGGNDDQMSAMEALQGPNGHFANLGVNQGAIASLTDGSWHVDERIYVAESTAGAGDGQYRAYLDGALVAQYLNVDWLAEGGTWGVAFWLADPTFGGAAATVHPLAGDFWDFDQLYVSTK